MDSLRTAKIVGTLCVAGLIFLFGRWAAESLIGRGAPDMAHGTAEAEGHEAPAQAYTVEVADAAHEESGEEEAGEDVAALLAAGDAEKGAKAYGKCKACHKTVAGQNGTGPSLAGIVGRTAGTEAGYKFSPAMAEYGQEWTPENLFVFLGDVKGTVPGTKMTFKGISKTDQRADLIAYLATLQ